MAASEEVLKLFFEAHLILDIKKNIQTSKNSFEKLWWKLIFKMKAGSPV